jgi:catechol 2,3-dioxygenase-like lactoylglutathione lyase family enzyme
MNSAIFTCSPDHRSRNMSALQIAGTHHIALATRNFDRLRDFYTETLGLPILGGFPGERILFIGAGSTAIELIEEGTTPPSADPIGWSHLALEVADLDAAHATLTARGVSFHVLPEPYPLTAPTVRIAFLRDPDGNEIELIQPLASRYPGLSE